MEIIEYNKTYQEDVKDLLVELQKYVVSIDKYHLNIVSPQYREVYFKKTLKLIKQNNGKIFVAVKDNKAIGMIAGYIQKYDKLDRIDYTCPKKGIVEELIVSSTNRDKGVGNQLLACMENFFRENNCEFCQVDVFSYNDIGKNFYNKYNLENRMETMFKKL